MKVGEVVRYYQFLVKILEINEYEGIEYAEIEPVEFKSISREVKLSELKPL